MTDVSLAMGMQFRMTTTLAVNALTTLAKAKAEIGIPDGDTSQDTVLEGYINAASQHIETFTNRKFHRQSYTHYLTGNDTPELLLLQFPIEKPSEVNIDDEWTFGAGTRLASSHFDVLYDCVLVKQVGYFPRKPRNVKVSYYAGYETIPVDVERACLLLVTWLYGMKSSETLGVTSKSKMGDSVTLDANIPPLIKTLLEPWKRDVWVKNQLPILITGG